MAAGFRVSAVIVATRNAVSMTVRPDQKSGRALYAALLRRYGAFGGVAEWFSGERAIKLCPDVGSIPTAPIACLGTPHGRWPSAEIFRA